MKVPSSTGSGLAAGVTTSVRSSHSLVADTVDLVNVHGGELRPGSGLLSATGTVSPSAGAVPTTVLWSMGLKPRKEWVGAADLVPALALEGGAK